MTSNVVNRPITGALYQLPNQTWSIKNIDKGISRYGATIPAMTVVLCLGPVPRKLRTAMLLSYVLHDETILVVPNGALTTKVS